MSHYNYKLLDPRPAARDTQLAWLREHPALGVEVTVPELAEACSFGNVDPQHSEGNAGKAAIEATLGWPRSLPTGTWLVTVRPDADALGSMALLEIIQEQHDYNGCGEYCGCGDYLPDGVVHHALQIGQADRSPSGDGPITALSAVRATCMDHTRPLDERVQLCREFLLTGSFAGAEDVMERLRADRAETDEVAAHVRVRDGIAVVESTSRHAVAAAYRHADVVVAVNPEFRFAGGEPHRKVTVCQARPGLVDLAAVWADLSAREPGWGGSPTVGGSPQGVGSAIPTDEVVAVVAAHRL